MTIDYQRLARIAAEASREDPDGDDTRNMNAHDAAAWMCRPNAPPLTAGQKARRALADREGRLVVDALMRASGRKMSIERRIYWGLAYTLAGVIVWVGGTENARLHGYYNGVEPPDAGFLDVLDVISLMAGLGVLFACAWMCEVFDRTRRDSA